MLPWNTRAVRRCCLRNPSLFCIAIWEKPLTHLTNTCHMLTLRITATRPENPARLWQWQTKHSSEQPLFTSLQCASCSLATRLLRRTYNQDEVLLLEHSIEVKDRGQCALKNTLEYKMKRKVKEITKDKCKKKQTNHSSTIRIVHLPRVSKMPRWAGKCSNSPAWSGKNCQAATIS